MEKGINYLQNKWENNFLPGIDCIVFKDGKVTIANTYKVANPDTMKNEHYWFPFCDTTIDSLENYETDIWTEIGICGTINHENKIIVYGEGSMGNEGFIASTDLNNQLDWAVFFESSNPIWSAEIINEELICISELETIISIQLNDLTKISIETKY
jgi:hypothetical protein